MIRIVALWVSFFCLFQGLALGVERDFSRETNLEGSARVFLNDPEKTVVFKKRKAMMELFRGDQKENLLKAIETESFRAIKLLNFLCQQSGHLALGDNYIVEFLWHDINRDIDFVVGRELELDIIDSSEAYKEVLFFWEALHSHPRSSMVVLKDYLEGF